MHYNKFTLIIDNFIQLYTFQEDISDTNKIIPHEGDTKHKTFVFLESALGVWARERSFNYPAYFESLHSSSGIVSESFFIHIKNSAWAVRLETSRSWAPNHGSGWGKGDVGNVTDNSGSEKQNECRREGRWRLDGKATRQHCGEPAQWRERGRAKGRQAKVSDLLMRSEPESTEPALKVPPSDSGVSNHRNDPKWITVLFN